jgi:hypothetical protein
MATRRFRNGIQPGRWGPLERGLITPPLAHLPLAWIEILAVAIANLIPGVHQYVAIAILVGQPKPCIILELSFL